MLKHILHPLPLQTLDRYTRYIYGSLKLGVNRPATLTHLETLLQFETDYLVALQDLTYKGKHYSVLAALDDADFEELDLAFELSEQAQLIEVLQGWQSMLLAVILGEVGDDILCGLETEVALFFNVG